MGNKLFVGKAAGKNTFTLPLDFITETSVILAKRGAGKSYTASVLAEEMLQAVQQAVIIDPMGAWWGLKSSADGTRPGFPVVIFGGEHADVPLEHTAGELVAKVIVERKISAILDLSLMSKSKANYFVGQFVETLFLLNRDPLHVFVDEADLFAPQMQGKGGNGMVTLGAMEDLARRGRQRGLGSTWITQRPAVLNKSVLTQAEVLIALKLVHPRDIQPIKEWVEVNGDMAQAKVMIESLPALPVGTAWIWSPSMGIFEKVPVRERATFDSSATPKHGQRRVVPKHLAEVDIARLGEEIQATVAKIKENDPAALKARIRLLEAAVAQPATKGTTAVVDSTVVTKAVTAALEKSEKSHQVIYQGLLRDLDDIEVELEKLTANMTMRANKLRDKLNRYINTMPQAPMTVTTAPGRPMREAREPDPIVSTPRQARVSAGPGEKLPKAVRLILTVLAQFGNCTRTRIAAIAGYSVNGGGFANALGAARSSGFVSYSSDQVTITPEGLEVLGSYDPLPTGQALIDYWLNRLPKAQRAILKYLTEVYPVPADRDSIAQATGYEEKGGGFANALGALRTLELINRGSEIKASEDLFA